MKIAVTLLLCLAGAPGLRAQARSACPCLGCRMPALAAAPQSIEESGLRQLLTLKRVYVDRLTGGETAAQMRDIIIASLQNRSSSL